MRNMWTCVLSILILSASVATQNKPAGPKRYALPPGVAVEGDATVMRTGGAGVGLMEGGSVPGEGGTYSCWDSPANTERATVGYTLTHYDNKQSFDEAVLGMKYLGGWRTLMESGYKSVGDPNQQTGTPFVSKTAFAFENIGGVQTASWTETWACVQAAHPRRILSIVKARFEDNNTTVDIEAGGPISPATAKKLVLDVIANVRKLDYNTIK